MCRSINSNILTASSFDESQSTKPFTGLTQTVIVYIATSLLGEHFNMFDHLK